ncbi:MAG TPA: sigma-70 family RNA polymerase sigma factor [Elusimicrobiota bacterium]|nr:sigma-70 family RNA polymerase sigma factor [Elusimicrobiota bacterium]
MTDDARAPSILYVEDEEDYQILVRRILERAGMPLRVAETGQQGLAMLRERRPDLLILDINLPDTDGYSLCQLLRQDPAWADLPILMLTVRRRPEEWLRGFSSGANDYLSKPLNPPELVERVRNGLNGTMQQNANAGTPEYLLIQAAVAGNRAAFEILIQKHKARLIDNLRQGGRDALEAEDMASQAFLLAFENLREFRGEASFYTWLYRIAMNAVSHSQRAPRAVSLEEITCGDDSAWPAALAHTEAPAEASEDRPPAEHMSAVLDQLPDRYRQILTLYFVKEMPYDAIARKLDIPIGTVMSRLFKARHLLKEAWNKTAGVHS